MSLFAELRAIRRGANRFFRSAACSRGLDQKPQTSKAGGLRYHSVTSGSRLQEPLGLAEMRESLLRGAAHGLNRRTG